MWTIGKHNSMDLFLGEIRACSIRTSTTKNGNWILVVWLPSITLLSYRQSYPKKEEAQAAGVRVVQWWLDKAHLKRINDDSI